MVPPVKRRYHAPVREEQAAQTGQRIAAAAAAEFAEHGWSGWPPGQYADWLTGQLGAAVQAARRPGPAR